MNLTSVQRRTLDELMRRDPLPVFELDLADRLRSDLERRLAPLAEHVSPGDSITVTKSRLTDLHARCEGLFVANHLGEGERRLSWQLAAGALAHKAIEMGVYARGLTEAELVDRALRRLTEDDERYGEFVDGLDPGDRALFESEATNGVTLFHATFPPIERSWAPAVEMTLKVKLLGGRVVLWARPDLVLGAVDPEQTGRARRLLLDVKARGIHPDHAEDLRFYALVAALRLGVPPYRVASVSLEDGSWHAQDVTEDLLESAVRRVGDGYTRVPGLLTTEEVRLRPGPWCRWCPRSLTCPESSARPTNGGEPG